MTTISNSSFFAGTLFSQVHTAGKTRPLPLMVPTYWAVRADRSAVVACANIASARAIAEGRAPNKDVQPTTYTYNCEAFVSPSGQFYVNIHAGSQVVRMDVANAQTARHYVRNGVDTELACEAYLSELSR